MGVTFVQRKGRSLFTSSSPVQGAAWYAIWTRSHCEQLVSDQLCAKDFNVFLPKSTVWSTSRGKRRQIELPLFPGYLFVHRDMDKYSHVEIIKARGVVRVLGERWDRLETVDDDIIADVRRLSGSGEPVQAHPHLHAGDRVRVIGGPFQGMRGIFLRERATKGLFVLSIDLLQRSVAVEVDCSLVEAA